MTYMNRISYVPFELKKCSEWVKCNQRLHREIVNPSSNEVTVVERVCSCKLEIQRSFKGLLRNVS
jgi:hypothetical protein